MHHVSNIEMVESNQLSTYRELDFTKFSLSTTLDEEFATYVRRHQEGAGDSWHSSKIIRTDEKNAGFVYMTIFGKFDSGNRVNL